MSITIYKIVLLWQKSRGAKCVKKTPIKNAEDAIAHFIAAGSTKELDGRATKRNAGPLRYENFCVCQHLFICQTYVIRFQKVKSWDVIWLQPPQ